MVHHLGNARVHVYWNDYDSEWRAEAYIEGLRHPGGILGYSENDPNQALNNLHDTAWGLGISFYIGYLNWDAQDVPHPKIDIRGRG